MTDSKLQALRGHVMVLLWQWLTEKLIMYPGASIKVSYQSGAYLEESLTLKNLI